MLQPEPPDYKLLRKMSPYRKLTSMLPYHCAYCGKTYKTLIGNIWTLLNPVGSIGMFCPNGHEGFTRELIDYRIYTILYDVAANKDRRQIGMFERRESQEYIACSAIWYKDISPKRNEDNNLYPKNINSGMVTTGHRHLQCMRTMTGFTGLRSVLPECGVYEQGFLTSKNRFVGRAEAVEIAYAAKQIRQKMRELHSEDIY